MAKTLQELEEENRKLKNAAKFRRELVDIGEERSKLAMENKRLLKQLNRSPTGVAIRKSLGIAGKTFFKTGKSVGKGLQRYGRFLEEKERKERRLRRKTTSRKIKRKR